MKNLRELNAWKALEEHFFNINHLKMKEMFEYDPNRAEKYTYELNGIYFDLSKNRINFDTFAHMNDLAKSVKLHLKVKSLFEGEKVNFTENRSALHPLLRFFEGKNIPIPEVEVVNQIFNDRNQLNQIVEKINDRDDIKHIVQIGIGGSSLGPRMAKRALKQFDNGRFDIHFVSNIDQNDLNFVLEQIDTEKTIFIIASKSFNTEETAYNLQSLLNHLNIELPDERFYAITSSYTRAINNGFTDENILSLNENIGGRYSIWSSIGITIPLMIGWDNFLKMLQGASKADEHFANEDYLTNIPVLLAFLEIWYRDFYGIRSKAVIPYDERLAYFTPYLQQLEMESNGKIIKSDGDKVNYATGNILFGNKGTDSQHSFFQMIHQGVDIIPTEFLCVLKADTDINAHRKLLSNCFAQSEALMKGRNPDETFEILSKDFDEERAEELTPYNIFLGNIPSTTIALSELTPETFGTLLAVYEHKVFTLASIWDINPFDQFGVELGKSLSKNIESELLENISGEHDASTKNLMNLFIKQNAQD